MNRGLLASVWIATTACGSGQSQPVGAERSPAARERTVEQGCGEAIELVKSIAKRVTASSGNCDALGNSLEKLAAENRELIAWVNDPARQGEYQTFCDPKMDQAIDRLLPEMDGLRSCQAHPKVQAFIMTTFK